LEERINAEVAVFVGIVTRKVPVAVLSEPKSNTAIDRPVLVVGFNLLAL
jgi:hypothetical protein